MAAFNSFFIGSHMAADNFCFENRSNKCTSLDLKTLREGVNWSAVETSPFVFDFSSLRERIDAANEKQIEIIWDLCQYGFPKGLSPTSAGFSERFAAYCEAFAIFYSNYAKKQLFVIPIAEITFLAWQANDHRTSFAPEVGLNTKYSLCKAAIRGINSLRRADPQCRILIVEPLIRVHAGSYTEAEHLFSLNEAQFQVMDTIAGRLYPELGGSEGHLDILGFNYDFYSQWEEGGKPLPWPEVFERRVPLSSLLKMVSNRYDRPLVVTETGHVGSNQLQWIEEIVNECLLAKDHDVQLQGIGLSLDLYNEDSQQEIERLICNTYTRLDELVLPSASAFG